MGTKDRIGTFLKERPLPGSISFERHCRDNDITVEFGPQTKTDPRYELMARVPLDLVSRGHMLLALVLADENDLSEAGDELYRSTGITLATLLGEIFYEGIAWARNNPDVQVEK